MASGSVVLTPNSSVFSNRVSASAPAKPMAKLMADMETQGVAISGNAFGGGRGLRGEFQRQAGLIDTTRLRAEARPFFRKIGLTNEFAESNYYHLRLPRPGGNFNGPVPLIPLWRDFAE